MKKEGFAISPVLTRYSSSLISNIACTRLHEIPVLSLPQRYRIAPSLSASGLKYADCRRVCFGLPEGCNSPEVWPRALDIIHSEAQVQDERSSPPPSGIQRGIPGLTPAKAFHCPRVGVSRGVDAFRPSWIRKKLAKKSGRKLVGR